MSLPNRDDVDDRYQWDLTQIFTTSAEWNEHLATLESELSTLDTDCPNTAEEWTELLDRIAACHRHKQRLELYATLARNVHTDASAAEDRMRRFRDVESVFESTMARVYSTIRALDETTTPDLDLDEDAYYLENLREQAKHARDPGIEETIAAYEETRTASNRILRAATTEDFDPPEVKRPDGTRIELTPGQFRRALPSRPSVSKTGVRRLSWSVRSLCGDDHNSVHRKAGGCEHARRCSGLRLGARTAVPPRVLP